MIARVVAALLEHKVDLIWPGWVHAITFTVFRCRFFRNAFLNIHPSLLPSFPGLESQKQALDYGVKFAGCTVHFVDENLDAGPIILQATVPVLDGDDEHTLGERILKEEHRIYTEAVKVILEGKYQINRPSRSIRLKICSDCPMEKLGFDADGKAIHLKNEPPAQ